VMQRKTQTAEYWQAFSLNQADIEFLRTTLVDAERPLTTLQLAESLVSERVRREESELRAELARGVLYQPKKQYALGDSVIFPQLDYRLGEVVDQRAGENPEYGQFEVITVDFGPSKRRREFAASLNAAHKLNADLPDMLQAAAPVHSDGLLADFARDLPAVLEQALREDDGFASFEGHWLPRDLLVEVHVGHLNIAEAIIDMNQTALSTAALQKELDLPAEIRDDIASFSLQAALAADERFDQVGPGDERRWFLRRLEPVEALTTPEALAYRGGPADADALTPDLAKLAFEMDDEWSDGLEASDARRAAQTATITLTYPHAISGTLPLNRHAQLLFPQGFGDRTMVTLIDGRWGNRFSGWVNRAGRYVAGLSGWMEKHKLPAGAYITLERRDDGEVVVDFRPKRMRREWMRWAQLTDEGRLDIQVRKQEISCEYDEQMVIGGDKTDELANLRQAYAAMPLAQLVFEVFSDLAGLSGSVHAKTVYSAVNVVRRVTPEPVFAALASDDRLERLPENSFRLIA